MMKLALPWARSDSNYETTSAFTLRVVRRQADAGLAAEAAGGHDRRDRREPAEARADQGSLAADRGRDEHMHGPGGRGATGETVVSDSEQLPIKSSAQGCTRSTLHDKQMLSE